MNRIGRFPALAIAVALAFLALAGSPRPAKAQQFLATQIENLISTDTMKVRIEGLSGALSGDIRIEKLTVSDPQGVFLTAENLAMDWSPFALVRSTVSIENLTAGRIVLERLPTGQPAKTEDANDKGGGFSLPSISAKVQNFAIDEFVLGEAIAGMRARLKINASLDLESDPTNLSVKADIQRLDQPGQIALNLAYAPAQNQLNIDINASEPAGGLVATLLDIPDRPAVNLTVNGSGPLSNFTAKGSLNVGDTQAASLTASTSETDAGRRVQARLSVAAQRFVPSQYARYVEGGATLDANVLVRPDGTYAIDQAQLSSNALRLSAAGTLDLSGAGNDLMLSLASADGSPITYSLGEAPSRVDVALASLNGTLKGALSNAALELTAQLPRAGYGAYQAENLGADVKSSGFDLKAMTGPFKVALNAASVSAPDGIQDRLLTGPVSITVDGALTANGLRFDPSSAKTDTLQVDLQGTSALNFGTFDLDLQTTVQTNALSAAAIPLAGDTIRVSGNFQRSPQTTIAVNDLKVVSSGLSIAGDASLANGNVSADISGSLQQASDLSPTLAGSATFALKASGAVEKPDVDLTLSGNDLSINGRKLADLKVSARGTLNPASPSGSVAITGTLDGQPLAGSAKVTTLDNGERVIDDIEIRQGPNTITGDLRLTDAFAPIGKLKVDVDDIGPLASLGGLQAAGDVKGSVELTVDDAKTPVAAVDLTGNNLTVAGNALQGARIDLSVADYLGVPKPSGTIAASAIAAGGVAVNDLDVRLDQAGDFTTLAANAAVDGVPITLGGQAKFAPDETVVMLQKLTAQVPQTPVTLADTATIRIVDGRTTLDALRLLVGGQSLVVQGSVGDRLDLMAQLDAIPVAVVNPFVPGIEASGTLSGTASVTGTPSQPEATFEVAGRDLTTAELKRTQVPPLVLDAAGRYENGNAVIQNATIEVGNGRVQASGTVGKDLDFQASLSDFPVALANGFVDGLNAEGTLSGNASATGTLAEPNAQFQLTGTGITAQQIAAAGIAPLTLQVAGSYADKVATIRQGDIQVGDGSLSVSGTVGDTLDVNMQASEFPVGLVNGFVPNLQATGTISGSAAASGPVSDPNATFDLSGSGITTRAISQSGIKPLSLRLAGRYADGTATLQTAVVNVGEGSLTASGKVGQNLDLTVQMNRIPVGLANGFVPDLDARGTISGSARATGTLQDPNARFDLSGSGITTEAIAQNGIDPLTLDVAGTYANQQLDLARADIEVGSGSVRASGTVGKDLDLKLTIDSLPVGLANGFVDGLDATGTISGSGTATGSLSDPKAEFQLKGSGITTQQIAQSGIAPLSLDLAGSYAQGTATIANARLDVGDGSLTAEGTIGKTLDFRANIDDLPVGLANGFVKDLGARGTISGKATATGSLSDPEAQFSLSGSGITTRQIAQSGVAPISLNVAGSYADGTATIAMADIDVGDGSVRASGTVGKTLDVDLSIEQLPVGLANGFVKDLGARGTISGKATATGSLSDPEAQFSLSGSGITTRQIAQSGVAPLSLSANGSYANGTAKIANADVNVGEGSLSASGTVGQNLDMDVKIDRLPVGLANGFVDGLGAQGTLSGTASATGSIADPTASFDISANGVSVAQSRAAGAPPLAARVSGRYADQTLTLSQARVTIGGGTITATGSVSPSQLNVNARINALPASIASAAAAGVNPQGTINGTVSATGSPSSPQVRYDIQASGVSIQQTRDAGVGPLSIATSGTFADKRVTTDTRLSGDGLAFNANGSVNIAGTPTLDLRLDGTAPLSLANRILAEGGRSAQGTVRVNATVTGPVTQPNVNGTISTAGATFTDATANIALNNITTTIALNGQTARFETFTAQLSSGGTLTIGGTVGLNNGFPADLSIRLVNGRYVDGELITAQLGANLTLTGPLTGTPTLAGTINAEEINILVPENLPSSLAKIDVVHRHARPAVYKQQEELFPNRNAGANPGGGINLDLTFTAPARVFVRGRGLDLELGGTIRINGNASSPNIVGGFELKRGRLMLLSQRLTFTRGRLTFTGGLVPTLDLLASTDAGDNVTVFIAVTGPATDPTFTFTSTPALPQDEVLARLIFGQATTDLSPLQIAQLADAVATLTGNGGSSSLLESLRSQLGVDDIDVRTTADGQTAVGVGKYLNDNTYLGVDSTGRVAVDIDIGKGLKARGAVTATGGGEVGVFYEGQF